MRRCPMSADAYDALQHGAELAQQALRALAGADRIDKTDEAIAALQASRSAQESAILARWQIADGRCILVISDVAPTIDMRKELAADMAALGWERFGGGIYRKLVPRTALERADWDAITRAMVERRTADLERQVAEAKGGLNVEG